MRAPSLCENAIRIDRGDSCASHQSEKIADRKKYWIGGYKECSNAKLAKTASAASESCQSGSGSWWPSRARTRIMARCPGAPHAAAPEAQLSAQDVETNLRDGAPGRSECGR